MNNNFVQGSKTSVATNRFAEETSQSAEFNKEERTKRKLRNIKRRTPSNLKWSNHSRLRSSLTNKQLRQIVVKLFILEL